MEKFQEQKVHAGALSGDSLARPVPYPDPYRLPLHLAVRLLLGASVVAWVALLGAMMWVWRAWP
jgi:hypothetical protein